MALTAVVAATLATLSLAAHDPEVDDIDLERSLGQLACGTKQAVHSYLGMSLNIVTAVGNLSLTAMDDLPDIPSIVTSLHLPLNTTPQPTTSSTVTFYAGKAGAFVDLAADLGWILSPAPGTMILDGHLTTPDQDSETGLGAISLANQATGVLIERGHSPEAAPRELLRLARRAGLPSVEYAAQLLPNRTFHDQQALKDVQPR